jgi:putative ABC transport system ATP-binding protein
MSTTTSILPYERDAALTTPPPDVAVHIDGVTKSYGSGASRVTALRGIDLDIRMGELMMLVGPSGCGKTTLISVIAGILDQDEGDCRVFGQDFKRMRQGDRTRYRGHNIGFVFQAFNLLPTLNAAENVSVPLLINGVPRGKALKRAKEMLGRVGLSERGSSLPSQLSGGQQQRVAIARALIHDPKLIVCDEPTSALDHETGHKVMEILREVALKPDRALVIVTHDARIFSFADRIARMDDGHVVRVAKSIDEIQQTAAAVNQAVVSSP